MNWKSGTIIHVGKTEDGQVRLSFKRENPKEGQTAHFQLVLLKDTVGAWKKGDFFKDSNFVEGEKNKGHDCYYQEHEKPIMDSQSKYVKSDGKEAPTPKQIPPKDVPAFYLDSDLAAAMVVIRASEMCESVECELESFDEASNFLMTEIRKLVK